MKRDHQNPSKYNPEERGRYYNWLHHNKKLLKSGEMKAERAEMFEKLMEMLELKSSTT